MKRLVLLSITGLFEASGQSSPDTGYFSQIASGGGWKTTLTVINPWNTAQRAAFMFLNSQGEPMSLPLTVRIGTSSGEPLVAAIVSRSIPPLATLVIETESGGDSVLQGWAFVLSASRLSGSGVFRQRRPDGTIVEAGIPLAYDAKGTLAMTFDNSNGAATGIALVNLSDKPINIGMITRDETGQYAPSADIQLPALGHRAFDLLSVAGRVPVHGSLELVAQAPNAEIIGIGLRFTPGGGITALPVVSPEVAISP